MSPSLNKNGIKIKLPNACVEPLSKVVKFGPKAQHQPMTLKMTQMDSQD